MRLYVLLAFSFLGAASVRAQIPNAVPCMGTAVNGMRVRVQQIRAQAPAWAMTSWPYGAPVTAYSAIYFQLPPLLQDFTSRHECGHAVTRNPDEFAANCFALANGNYSPQQIAEIGQFFQNLPFPVGAQYGGSGAAFWSGTMARCPQFFPSPPTTRIQTAPSDSEDSPHQTEHPATVPQNRFKGAVNTLNQILSVCAVKFRTLRSSYSGTYDGEKAWDGDIQFGGNDACTVWAGGDELDPRVTCSLKKGIAHGDPDDAYEDAKDVIKRSIGQQGNYSEEGSPGKMQTFRASNDHCSIELHSYPRRDGDASVDLEVDAPQPSQ